MSRKLSGKHVLIVGDSLSDATDGRPGTFGAIPRRTITPGQFLAKRLRKIGAKSVRIHAKQGRSAHVFVSRQGGIALLKRERAAHRPDVVVIVLGTNDLHFPEKATERALRRIRGVFKGVPVYHVGPPAFAERVRNRSRVSYNALAKRVVRAGRAVFGSRFIDARLTTRDIVEPSQGRAGDLIHFKLSGAEVVAARWATALNAATLPLPRKPIRGIGPATLLSAGLMWIIERRERLKENETGTE